VSSSLMIQWVRQTEPALIFPRPSLQFRVSPTGPIRILTASHAPLSLFAQLQHQLGSPAALNKVYPPMSVTGSGWTGCASHFNTHRHRQTQTETQRHRHRDTDRQTQRHRHTHTHTHRQQACLPVLDTGEGHSSLTTSTMGHQPSPSMLRAVVGVGAAGSSRA
jgi:hypothetical protein